MKIMKLKLESAMKNLNSLLLASELTTYNNNIHSMRHCGNQNVDALWMMLVLNLVFHNFHCSDNSICTFLAN